MLFYVCNDYFGGNLMNKAKITFKGQVTIPKEVRNSLDIKEGDSVIFVIQKDYAVLKPLKKKSLKDFYGVLPATQPYSGMESVREKVHHKIAKHLLGKEKE
ncbi:MAG: AbrB/MazE/SpoVT family DNA-binding domain-containing protein [Deltaproteobacteria bacterium]|nr:MAG: AbrB/MazE/SpoVT family DNA-binding domain-containing protein [Deltaproteobacteria bacterium]